MHIHQHSSAPYGSFHTFVNFPLACTVITLLNRRLSLNNTFHTLWTQKSDRRFWLLFCMLYQCTSSMKRVWKKVRKGPQYLYQKHFSMLATRIFKYIKCALPFEFLLRRSSFILWTTLTSRRREIFWNCFLSSRTLKESLRFRNAIVLDCIYFPWWLTILENDFMAPHLALQMDASVCILHLDWYTRVPILHHDNLDCAVCWVMKPYSLVDGYKISQGPTVYIFIV